MVSRIGSCGCVRGSPPTRGTLMPIKSVGESAYARQADLIYGACWLPTVLDIFFLRVLSCIVNPSSSSMSNSRRKIMLSMKTLQILCFVFFLIIILNSTLHFYFSFRFFKIFSKFLFFRFISHSLSILWAKRFFNFLFLFIFLFLYFIFFFIFAFFSVLIDFFKNYIECTYGMYKECVKKLQDSCLLRNY